MSALLLLLGAFSAAPATEATDYSVKETRQVLDRYGQCIVKAHRDRASEAILANAGNEELLRRYSNLMDGDCLAAASDRGGNFTIQAKFAGDQYRYALADALVRQELASWPAPKLETVPKLDHRDPGDPPAATGRNGKPLRASAYEKLVKAYDQKRAASYLSRYGECVVRLDPTGARTLLLAPVETPQEAAAFAAMRDSFATCVPEGETLTFSKVTMRGTIAVNYYRLSKAASGMAQAGASR